MQAVIDTVPTGVIYSMPAAQETRAEGLAVIDVDNLIGALRDRVAEPTTVTPQHEWLIASFALLYASLSGLTSLSVLAPLSGSSLDLVAHSVRRLMLLRDRKVFDATPSVIESARASMADVQRRPESDPPAYEAYKALGRWLAAGDAAIADMVGVGRTTPYTWKRDGREPRAATVQRIYEYHATLDSLRRRLGIVGLRRWLHEGVPSRRETLLAGELERLEADVHAELFRRPPTRRVDLGAAPDDTTPIETTHAERSLRPSGRRPRRAGG
jgi:hypothetical protein